MTAIVTISSKGQFTIPKALREQYGLKPGDRVTVTIENGAIVLIPIRTKIEEAADSMTREKEPLH